MYDIGKPVEIIEVEPLVLPAPLRRETEQPLTIEVLVSVSDPTFEPVTVLEKPWHPQQRKGRANMSRLSRKEEQQLLAEIYAKAERRQAAKKAGVPQVGVLKHDWRLLSAYTLKSGTSSK
jgi:hypothetical protein